MSFTQLDDIL